VKSEFPLLSALIVNGERPPLTPDLHLIDAQEATDRYWGGKSGPVEGSPFYLARDLGCLVPPFPEMWIESTAILTAPGTIRHVRVGYHMECRQGEAARQAINGSVPFDVTRVEWAYGFNIYLERPGFLPAFGVLFLDGAGQYLGYSTGLNDGVPDESFEEMHKAVWQLGKAAFFAISLMNCRNVRTSTEQTKRRGGKKTKRRPAPSVEYRVIHLPKSDSGPTRCGNAPGTTKLHTARGHFKTYTAEAPLMGKHTGTYYWGWQVRGRKENGEIVSSYKVGMAS
jgi:hypothetical protein